MANRSDAEEALFDAITAAAHGATESPEKIKELSQAFCNIVYGPQGGVSYDESHEIKHHGEDRKRPRAGFDREDP